MQEQWTEGDVTSPSTDRPRVKRWRERAREVEPPLPGSIVFAASDAMNLRGAGVRWVEDSCMVIPEVARSWSEDEQEEHINWKECQMAIDTANFMLDSNSFLGSWEIVLGVDNSTTKFAMTSFFFSNVSRSHSATVAACGTVLHHCNARLTTVHVCLVTSWRLMHHRGYVRLTQEFAPSVSLHSSVVEIMLCDCVVFDSMIPDPLRAVIL